MPRALFSESLTSAQDTVRSIRTCQACRIAPTPLPPAAGHAYAGWYEYPSTIRIRTVRFAQQWRRLVGLGFLFLVQPARTDADATRTDAQPGGEFDRAGQLRSRQTDRVAAPHRQRRRDGRFQLDGTVQSVIGQRCRTPRGTVAGHGHHAARGGCDNSRLDAARMDRENTAHMAATV